MSKKKATTVEFSEKAHDELERIKVATGAPSGAEVVRNALSLYAFLVDELQDGCDLAVVSGEKILKTVVCPGVLPTHPHL